MQGIDGRTQKPNNGQTTQRLTTADAVATPWPQRRREEAELLDPEAGVTHGSCPQGRPSLQRRLRAGFSLALTVPRLPPGLSPLLDGLGVGTVG